MQLGTVERSQRTASSAQLSWYSQVYSSKFWISSTTSAIGSSSATSPWASRRRAFSGGEGTSAYTWSPARKSASGQVVVSVVAIRRASPTSASAPKRRRLAGSIGAARRQEPNARRKVSPSEKVRITLGGKAEASGGHTRAPSRSTPYSCSVPGASPVRDTSA